MHLYSVVNKVNDIDTLVVHLILIYYISSIPIYTVYEIPLAWIITSYVIDIFNYVGFVPGNSWLHCRINGYFTTVWSIYSKFQ